MTLSDFFSRLIIYPSGQLNVQSIAVKSGETQDSGESGTTASNTDSKQKPAAQEDKPAPASPPAQEGKAVPPPITII